MDVVTYAAAVETAKKYTDEQGGGGSSDAVKYTEQSLTSAQQAQARENIGAAAAAIDYSTTEQDTGIKWVDGKSVYQKTYVFDPPVESGGAYVDAVDVSNLTIDTLVYMSGGEHDAASGHDANVAVFDSYSSVPNNLYLTADKATVKYISPLAMDFLTLRYTKTANGNE